MSTLNLVSILTLVLVLAVGLIVRRRLKHYLKNVDGVIGLATQSELEETNPKK